IESASIVGLSDGGIVGFDIAIHHPDRVTKLVVSGANFAMNGYDPSGLAWLQTTGPDQWPRTIREAYERVSPDGPDHWPIFFARVRRMWSIEPDYTLTEMRRINAPTLVIVGDKDIVTPEHAVQTFRTIPGAQLCVVPNEGHAPFPVETVLNFLKTSAESR